MTLLDEIHTELASKQYEWLVRNQFQIITVLLCEMKKDMTDMNRFLFLLIFIINIKKTYIQLTGFGNITVDLIQIKYMGNVQ